MTESRTAFELALPAPTLESPLLFGRHADRIEATLREAYPAQSGYTVGRKMKTERGRQTWEVEVHRGWLSGARVVLRLRPASPHRAQIDVDWDSPLSRALLLLGGLAGLPFGLVILVVTLYFVRSPLFTFLLLAALIFVWIFVVGIGAQVAGRLLAAVAGNEFDTDRRASITERIRALPLDMRP